MSLMCPIAKCKEQKGMCTCEKVLSAIVVLVALAAVIRHFAA